MCVCVCVCVCVQRLSSMCVCVNHVSSVCPAFVCVCVCTVCECVSGVFSVPDSSPYFPNCASPSDHSLSTSPLISPSDCSVLIFSFSSERGSRRDYSCLAATPLALSLELMASLASQTDAPPRYTLDGPFRTIITTGETKTTTQLIRRTLITRWR